MDGSGAMVTVCEIYLYGITGRKLATYSCGYHDNYDDGGDGTFWWLEKNRNVYFAGQPVELEGVAVVTDRLGSVRASGNGQQMAYYPYGEERTSTANGESKFGTYFRDPGGLDYADQRYYNSGMGSFTAPDPLGMRSADAGNPGSWNRFAYANGDPINFTDRNGTNVDECTPGDDSTYCQFRNGSSGYRGYGFYGYWGSEGYVNVYGPVFYQQPGQRGGGGGGGSNSSGSTQGPPPCPPVANLPGQDAASTIQENVNTAKAYLQNALNADPETALMQTFGFLTSKFAPGGDWDYKKDYSRKLDKTDARIFGNFDFGAVMQSLGFSLYFTQNAAGLAQIGICLSGGSCGTGIPGVLWPYGDQANDARDVESGYKYEAAIQAKCNPGN